MHIILHEHTTYRAVATYSTPCCINILCAMFYTMHFILYTHCLLHCITYHIHIPYTTIDTLYTILCTHSTHCALCTVLYTHTVQLHTLQTVLYTRAVLYTITHTVHSCYTHVLYTIPHTIHCAIHTHCTLLHTLYTVLYTRAVHYSTHHTLYYIHCTLHYTLHCTTGLTNTSGMPDLPFCPIFAIFPFPATGTRHSSAPVQACSVLKS